MTFGEMMWSVRKLHDQKKSEKEAIEEQHRNIRAKTRRR